MNHKIKSLNDLTIALHEINKKYKVVDFVEEYKKAVGDASGFILEELKMDSTTNPFQKLVNVSSKITDEMLEKLSFSTDGLTEKYNYNEYLDECSSLRQLFFKDRKNYFSSKVVVNSRKRDDIQNIFDLSGTADVILGDFIDKVLSKINPSHLNIIYEDLNGNKISTKIKHKIPSVTKDHVEAPLIDRYHGINAYDSFLLRSYYDIKKRDWIYIPMRLIIKLDCEDNLIDLVQSIE
jgi:hypothetical protein